MYFLQPSQKRLLTNFNAIFLSFFVLALILVKSTSEALVPSSLRGWDLLLPVVIYVGQRRTLIEGLLLVLFIGHLYSLNSAAPMGMLMIFYLLIFFIARLLAYVIYANTVASVMVLIFVLTIGSRFILPLNAHFFAHSLPIFSGTTFGFWSLVINTSAGFIVYWLLGLLDRLTYKVPPRSIELGDNSL